jgi:DNA topoisomerase-2
VLFNTDDNDLLEYLNDDGMSIEPKYYIPIIPMLLVNGSEGIGTGYSTNIPCYNPKDIISNLKLLIKDPEADLIPMTPWYTGFKGTIIKESVNKFITTGVWKRNSQTLLEITELPIGRWTQTYKEFLDSLLEQNEIVDYTNNSDDLGVSFKIILQKSILDELITKNEIIKKFKLTSVINTSNMNVFDEDCKIRTVSCPEEIIYRFYLTRKAHFIKRKKHIIKKLNREYSVLLSKVKFIKYVIDEQIIIFNKKKDFIIEEIRRVGDLVQVDDSWDYLLDLKIWTFTKEKISDLEKTLLTVNNSLTEIKNKTVEQMWDSELSLITI